MSTRHRGSDLGQRLKEAEATIAALLTGQIDAVVDPENNTPVLLARAQEALRASEERYRRIVETTNEGVWLIGADNRTTFMNRRMAQMLGCEPDMGIGHPADEFLDESERARFLSGIRQPHAQQMEVRYVRSDGTTVRTLSEATPMFNSEGRYDGSLAMVMDITERTEAQAALRTTAAALLETNQRLNCSLQEKEVLLREIHHRVKNNLQIISSLLNMHSNRLQDVDNAKAMDLLEASQQRIRGMALIHDLLYSNESVGQIDLAEYVKNLAVMVLSSYKPGFLRIHGPFNSAPVPLSMRQAVPCGLIVNELVTNICKYAYPEAEAGEMIITVESSDDRIYLTVADQGIGMPVNVDWKSSGSLGLQIIGILTRQLGGVVEFQGEKGTSVSLSFPRESSGAAE